MQRSEEYKKIANLALVPSLIVLTLSAGTVIFTYAYKLNLYFEFVPAFIFTAISVLLAAAAIKQQKKHHNKTYIYYAIIPLLFAALISFRVCNLVDVKKTPQSNEYNGIVDDINETRYSKQLSVNFYPENLPQQKSTAIVYTGKDVSLNAGSIIKLSTPKAITPDDSYKTSLIKRGYQYSFYADNIKIIKQASPAAKHIIRASIEERLTGLFNSDTLPVIKALYFGNDDYIEKAEIADYKKAGVMHILSASGSHIAVVAAALFFVLAPFRINKKIIYLITLLVLIFYLYITDMPVSLIRAFIMFAVFAVQKFFDLETNIFNTLFISGIIILFVYPYELYSAGFQLSFSATLGIIAFYRFYKDTFEAMPAKIGNTSAVTLSAQLPVFPIIAYHIGDINIIGILSNIVIIPLMSLVMILSLLSLLASCLWFSLGGYLASITDLVYKINYYVVSFFSGSKGHFVFNSDYYLLLPYLLLFVPILTSKKKAASLAVISAIIFSWSVLYAVNYKDDRSIAVLKNSSSEISLYQKNNSAVICGKLGSIEDAQTMLRYQRVHDIGNIRLCITGADFESIKAYTYLIKNSIVSDCVVSSDFAFSDSFKKFCSIIDADKIRFKVYDMNKTADNKKPDVDAINANPELSISAHTAIMKGDHGEYGKIEYIK